MKKFIFIILGSAFVLAAIFIYQGNALSDKRLHLIFCDVGQGDGILITTPEGADIVIDGGPANGKMVECLNKYMPLGDRDIELMFATHPDADHIGGLTEVMRSYKVLSFNSTGTSSSTKIYKTLASLIQEQNIPHRKVSVGDKFTVEDGVVIEILWPPEDVNTEDTNEGSLVQVLRFHDFAALLTGDTTYQVLESLKYSDVFEVIKLAHHGSKTGMSDLTLQKIQAKFAVASLGKNNPYYHPHPSVLNILQKYGLNYLRTDERGTIEIVTDGITTKVAN